MAGSRTVGRSLTPALAAALLAVMPPDVADAQANRWAVRRDPFAELWYHGLALTSVRDFGPLPLYSAAYVREVGEERRRRGGSTRLDALASGLRTALTSESELEVLHFVPLYFVGEPPEYALAALHAALAGARPPATVSPGLAARANAIAASIPSAVSRATALAFVDALDEEWRSFLREERSRHAPGDAALSALQSSWSRTFEPALAQYLADEDRGRGILLVVPALGLEGRVVRGAGGYSIVAVAPAAHGMTAQAPLLAAVRELAFALIDRVPHAPGATSRNRLAAERAREVEAVRAGAFLIDAVAPRFAGAYRALFTSAMPGGAALDLDTAFPIPAVTETALRSLAARYAPAPVPAR